MLDCCAELPKDVGKVPVSPELLVVVADDESDAKDPALLTIPAVGDVLA